MKKFLARIFFTLGCLSTLCRAQYVNPTFTGTVTFNQSVTTGSAILPPLLLGTGIPSSATMLYGDGRWGPIPTGTLPSLSGSSGLFLSSNGTTAFWTALSAPGPIGAGTPGTAVFLGVTATTGTFVGDVMNRSLSSLAINRMYVENDAGATLGLIQYGSTVAGSYMGVTKAGAAMLSADNSGADPTSLVVGTPRAIPIYFSTNGTVAQKIDANQRIITKANPEFYGAAGDGTTDDTTAISNCITGVGAGGVVTLLPGRSYKTTSMITITTANVTISGYGATITSDTDAHFQKFRFSSTSGGKVLGVVFNCLYTSAGTGLSAGTVEIYNSNDCLVRDCFFNDIAKNAIYLYGTSARNKILANTFNDVFASIFSDDDTVNQPTYTTITDNTFRNGIGNGATNFSGSIKMSGNGGSANTHAGHVIANNDINCPNQMGIELQDTVNDCTVTGNTITGVATGISFSNVYRCATANNTVKATTSIGIEGASGATGCTHTGNVVEGKNSSGTVVCGLGYAISASTSTRIVGGTVSGCATDIAVQDSGGAVSKVIISGVGLGGGSGGNGDLVRIKTATDVTVQNCTFDVGASLNFDALALDTTDGAVSRIQVQGNHFVGTPANCWVQLYIPVTNQITYVTFSGNDTAGVLAGATTFFNESGAANSINNMKYVRCFGNTGIMTGASSFNTVFNVGAWAISGTLSFPYRYYAVEGAVCAASASGGAVTFQLPDAANMAGWEETVYKSDNSGNAVTVSTSASETINGTSTFSLASQFKRVTVRSDGANWVVMQSN